MLGTLSRGIIRIRHLSAFLEAKVVLLPAPKGVKLKGVVAWGRKSSAETSAEYARKHGISCFLRLEDGFLRSVMPGPNADSCSMVVDDLGIYYDASRPSRFEMLASIPLTIEEEMRAKRLVCQWKAAAISKYNHARNPAAIPSLPYVLVIDQTANDAAVTYGSADSSSFTQMLHAAIAAYPDCHVLVKEHPEVALGRKKGYLGEFLDRNPLQRVTRVAEDVHVVPLLQHARAIFTVTSQVGFEALLHGKTVHTFGMPFYAGWGLTVDTMPAPARRHPISLTQLAFAALVRYTRYVLPHTGQRCEIEEVIEHLALQRRIRSQLPAQLHAINFSRWKRPILRQFLQGHDVRFHRNLRTVPRDAAVVRWGRSGEVTSRPDVSVITVEDGFLRSVGLGAQLVRPVSWVFDRVGIYYDATTPSDLERLLNEHEFDASILARAARLRESIVRAGLTKYNVGAGDWKRPAGAKQVILVVGQVESDASLEFGAPGIRTNRELLESVRADAPDAYIVYKPHPDVMAGLRGRCTEEIALRALCDELVTDCPMHGLIHAVDRVHVLTSLAGFEALLRGKPVTVHGLPFYAGWGLTDDRCKAPRRQRPLTLDMLVAGALILYPRYVLRDPAGGFASPEQVVADLQAWRGEAPHTGKLQRLMRPLLRYWAGRTASRASRACGNC